MVSPLFYLMAAAMVLMALASYRYNKILFLVEGTAAVLSGLAVLVSDVLYRRNISTTVRSAKRVLTGEEEAAFQAFALPVAVVAPAGDIVWANEAFAGSLCGGRNFLGDNVLKYIYPKTFRQVMGVSPSDYRRGPDSCAPGSVHSGGDPLRTERKERGEGRRMAPSAKDLSQMVSGS